jgi:hypothetical protein
MVQSCDRPVWGILCTSCVRLSKRRQASKDAHRPICSFYPLVLKNLWASRTCLTVVGTHPLLDLQIASIFQEKLSSVELAFQLLSFFSHAAPKITAVGRVARCQHVCLMNPITYIRYYIYHSCFASFKRRLVDRPSLWVALGKRSNLIEFHGDGKLHHSTCAQWISGFRVWTLM